MRLELVLASHTRVQKLNTTVPTNTLFFLAAKQFVSSVIWLDAMKVFDKFCTGYLKALNGNVVSGIGGIH